MNSPSDYSDEETARVRQAQSSAGKPTRSLFEMPDTSLRGPQPQPPSSMFGNATLPLSLQNPRVGWLFIALGVFWLWFQGTFIDLNWTAGGILMTIASCYLFFAFWKRIYGLFIPGAILSGLALGIVLAGITNGVSVLWGLALGFLGIFFVGRRLYNQPSQWPVYPAVVLFAVGMIVLIATLPTFFGSAALVLPMVLIGLGLYLGWGQNRP